MSILGSQRGPGDSTCWYSHGKAAGQRGPRGTQWVWGSLGSGTLELGDPGPAVELGQHRQGERSMSRLGLSPALPDVRGYTIPHGQGAVSVTGAVLWDNACRNEDGPVPRPVMDVPHKSPGWQWHPGVVPTRDAWASWRSTAGLGSTHGGIRADPEKG